VSVEAISWALNLAPVPADRGGQPWRADRRPKGWDLEPHDHDGELIRLTAGEIRRLLANATQPSHPDHHYQRWSRWRRRHQARARKHHYQRRQQLHLRLLL
jgi:hypothetical protein